MTTTLEPGTEPGLRPDEIASAREFAEWLGDTPGRNELRRILRVGSEKASALRNALLTPDPGPEIIDIPVSPAPIDYTPQVVETAWPLLIARTPPLKPAPVPAAEPEARQSQPKRQKWALVAPLVLVNGAAVFGQQAWAYDHLRMGLIVAVLFACSVESIGIYLAAEAHAALMAGDASSRLRLGSYLVGALVGTLNYAHFANAGYAPNPVALTFGLLSSISPWLWAIRSRSLNRDRLRELGQIDPRAVRFSLLRWALFPIRTAKAFRNAVWVGIVQPSEAVAAADRLRPAKTCKPATVPA